MDELETPLARWSRLKREAKEEKSARPAEEPAGAAAMPEEGRAEAPAFDPATLPSIESITAGTDIRGFLQAGVPVHLTRAALRRVWTTDPAIRDFIEVAENQWDFANAAAVPGFGPLQPADNVAELVSRAMGRLDDTLEQVPAADSAATPRSAAPASLQRDTPVAPHEPPASGVQASGMPEGNRTGAQVAEPPGAVNRPDAAVQDCALPAEAGVALNRRSHGRALPQ